MRQALIFILLVVFSSAIAVAGIVGDLEFTKTYNNSAGAVHYDHQKHAALLVEDCAYCHSALKTFGGKVSELFAHKVCVVCHDSRNGPTDCSGCHLD